MAINNYIRPMLEVFQQLDITLNLTGDRLAACIVGADYDLYRYGHEDLTPDTFDMADGSQVIELRYEKNSAYEYGVDLDTMEVQAVGICATVGAVSAVATGNNYGLAVDDSDLFVLRTTEGTLFSWLGDIDDSITPALITGNKVQAGDELYITQSTNGAALDLATPIASLLANGDVIKKATVVDLVGKVEPATAYPVTVSDSTNCIMIGKVNGQSIPRDNVSSTPTELTESSNIKLKETTVYTATVTAIDDSTATKIVTLTVTDASGQDTAKKVVSDDALSVSVEMPNAGVTLEIGFLGQQTGLKVGDQTSVTVTAPYVSTTEFDGIRLNTLPVKLSVLNDYKVSATTGKKRLLGRVVRSYTGPIDSSVLKVTAQDKDSIGQIESVLLDGTVTMEIDDIAVPMENGIGDIYLNYRVQIIPPVTEDVFIVTDNADVQKYFGTIHPMNELAYGCSMALEGAAGRHIYALRVRSNDAEGYTEALNKVETNASTYSFCPLTDDITVIEAACEYVTKRSEPDVKRWCRVIAGIDSPGEYKVASTGIDGKPLRADILPVEHGYLLELSEDSGEFDFTQIHLNGSVSSVNAGFIASVQDGDWIELAATGMKYQVARVYSPSSLLLSNGPASGVDNVAISLWKGDSTENAGEYVAAAASRLNMRRCSLVWCDRGTRALTDTETIIVSNKFNAAFVAGLASSVVPQAPITHTEVTSIDSAVRMYTRYRQIDLDNIARHGVMIITQDAKNQPCYIRHQLTTETDKGSLYYEESCTRNLDNISYSITDVLEQYIGRSNVTPSALRAITTSVVETLTGFTQDSPSDLIGPSLVNWNDLSVTQDPIYKDRVIVKVKLYLPLPLNNIKVYEMAYAATVTI